MSEYIIMTDTSADIPEEILVKGHIQLIPMAFELNGEERVHSDPGNWDSKEFYGKLRDGGQGKTSQIPPMVYTEYFEKILKEGKDILYISLSGGLTSTWQSSKLAATDLMEEYPDRKISCVDSHAATGGQGILTLIARKNQEKGMSLEENTAWLEENRNNICHWFTVDMLDHLRHGGRISAASAAIGTVLNIKPLLHVAEDGTLKVMDKPRGRKKAFKLQMSKMEQGWLPELGKLVVIGHGDSMETALELKETVLSKYPDSEVRIADIGPVIGAHTGPGMLALIFWGTTR